MNNFFHFSERDTFYKQETMAGITTFLSVAYILVVNPLVLSQSGMDKGAVFTATALTAIIGTLLIGLLANYPITIAPSMGLNSFFTFSVTIGMGIEWPVALTGVFIAGIIFMILSLMKIREKIINVIPKDLKHAVASGIGFFIAFIGLKNAGIIVSDSDTFVTIGNLTSPMTALAVLGLILTVFMLVRGVNGGIFYGMVITTIIGMVAGAINIPSSFVGKIPSLEPTFGVVFSYLNQSFSAELVAVIFTFLFVAFFDTAGALIALTSQAGIMKDNRIPNAGRALLADSSAGVMGAILGTSTPATSVESSAGIAVGGRTGFTSVVIAACFAIALFFSPVLSVITTEVTAPALIIVGSLMAKQISNINWGKLEVVIPAFMTIIMMPLTSSVATGIAFGFILYPLSLVAQKRFKEVHPIMYVLCLLFVLYFVFIA
ncbi:putative MFS transporter, AGZA family, xanthine/uracil permease [Salinibacillus kushneri]|uniref:Putative MFS transporter, AGZA family, xanthine/uracil permease n=1 Tax=Salinibacillus kushneri TaxID=237682 RepID=A0A1I0INQ1_9BACI|nr:NCS2 family permease [Salinibacillus kushneri]SET98752.1 putative MFS transporter, AGZA family, xanthine/uracil permease [Salinibacillus kushneri]